LWIYLALLLPSLAGEVAQNPAPSDRRDDSSPRHSRHERSSPYLLVIGSPELRFQEEPPPPDWPAQPTTSKPKAEKVEPAPNHQDVIVSNRTPPTAPAATATVEKMNANSDQPPPAPPPPTILPDDVTPRVRPEDFLPYFQFPGAGQNEPNTAPTPRPIPPSSATYQEQ
jgi:hypothetical protein